MDKAGLQQLADMRIDEARALLTLAVPMPDGAYYLAGYAVECALKACIAGRYVAEIWPEKKFVADCHTHDISTLIRLAGLEQDRMLDVVGNLPRGQNWNIVKDRSEQSRYERHSHAAAQKLYDAIADVTHGVLPWIKVRW